jgi:hypothetical protein
MIALLVIQIIAVFLFGIEPANRRLEDIKLEEKPSPSSVKA